MTHPMFQAMFTPAPTEPASRRDYIAGQLREQRAKLIEQEVGLEIAYAMGDDAFEVVMRDKPIEERILWDAFLDRYHVSIGSTQRIIAKLETLLAAEPAPAAQTDPVDGTIEVNAKLLDVVSRARDFLAAWHTEGPLTATVDALEAAVKDFDALAEVEPADAIQRTD